MADSKLRDAYKAFLAELYPGSTIEPPRAITIGGAPPGITIDFGVVKEDGSWRIPEAFADLAGPLLRREAFRAGLPEKAARSTGWVHACNWFAWKSIPDAALQKKFYRLWLAASEAAEPRADKYKLPPALIREFDKALDVDPRELHELLVRYSAENERLLGKQLRYDAAEQWAFHKAMELAPVPRPAVVELLLASSQLSMQAPGPPSREAIVEQALRNGRFTASPSANMFKDAFPTFSNIAFVALQLDISMIGKRYVYAFITPSPRASKLDWEALLRFPGMAFGIDQVQGAIEPGEGMHPTVFARFAVPTTALDAIAEYFTALEDCGLAASIEAYHATDAWFTVNYNCYVPHPASPAFTIDPIRADPSLFISQPIDLSISPARSKAFLDTIAREDVAGIHRFVRKAGSPFSFDAGRHDSWLTTLASQARTSCVVARRWHDLLAIQHRFLVPDPRNTYIFMTHVPVMTHLSLAIPGQVPAAARSRFLASFPASISSALGGVHVPDTTLIKVFVPRKQLHGAIQMAYREFPGARPYMELAARMPIAGYDPLAWFDGTGYAGAVSAIQKYTSAIPNVAKGAWSTARFVQEVERPLSEACTVP
ncbi:MAG: hypothetical protein GYA24_04165 [Candidatus Lokiarchaeota archaeon]|nr:hypothetical protein [Candidatus Lokiarchaeota archaeon]